MIIDILITVQWIFEPSTSCQGPITIVNRVFSKKNVYLDTNGSKELQYFEIKGVKVNLCAVIITGEDVLHNIP